MTIKDRIDQIKIDNPGFSQLSLALELSMGESYVSKIVNYGHEPKVGLAIRISRVLKCSVEEVFSAWADGKVEEAQADDQLTLTRSRANG